MNGYKVVLVIVVHGIIGECFLNGIRNKKGKQRHFEGSSNNFYGYRVSNQKRHRNMIKSRLGLPDTNTSAFYTGKLYAKKKSLLARDERSEDDVELSNLPYIALPPNNILQDDETKVSSTSNIENSNAITKQQIPPTVIPIVVTAVPSSTIQTAKPLASTPTTYSTTHPTPQPVNINLVVPTVRPVVQASGSQQHAEEYNVTKIDLSLNIGEENPNPKPKPMVFQLPQTTSPAFVDVVSQIQKAQELKSQLSLLANPQLQRPFQGTSFWISPPAVASMLGLRNPYNPMSIAEEEMVSSQNTNPYRYPPGMLPPNIIPFQELSGLPPTLQQGLMRKNNPLAGLPNTNQLSPGSPLSSLLSNAIKSSLGQSQPDLITSALNQAALQAQAQNQPPQMVTSTLAQAIAKIVNNEPSEEQKLTDVLAAALNLAKVRESQKRYMPTTSSQKLELANPTNLQFNLVNEILKQGRAAAPAKQQIISVNVSPVIPQQIPLNAPSLTQPNPANLPPVLPQPYPANAPPLSQPNPANLSPVLPQPFPVNAPPLPEPNPSNLPQVLPQPYPASTPPLSQPYSSNPPPQNIPANAPPSPQSASYTSPILDHITASALGKAMAKALVHTAKKIVYNKSAMQRDRIISSNNMVPFPRHFISTAFFRQNRKRKPYYRTSSAVSGPNVFHSCPGPLKKKYLQHACCCCC